MRYHVFFIACVLGASTCLHAQQDTAKQYPVTATPLFQDTNHVMLKGDTAKMVITDTAGATAQKAKHDPRKATFRSAVLPGWGQAYNHEYWKIPIVYGALAVPATLYVYNNTYYKRMKYAYEAVYAATVPAVKDSSLLAAVSPTVKTNDGQFFALSTYQSYRNSFKRNKDYSLLWFLILWGVNVADATVFGHLKDFDVSDDLSLHINPQYLPATRSAGLSFVFNFKDQPRPKAVPSF